MFETQAAASDALSNSPPPEDTPATNKWGPYSGAGDFGANMAIVLAALLCAGILSFTLGATIRLLFRRRRGPRPSEKPDLKTDAALPTIVFSAAATDLAGVGAECVICLAEFAEGDAVLVLPACGHGFHGQCIERWLAARGTCPTCRRECGGDGQAEAV